MQEFLSEYAGVLRTLVRSDKRDINVLSMLAEDNKQYAEGIVSTIESHILTVSLHPFWASLPHSARCYAPPRSLFWLL